jgi:hypothetical protein
MLVASAQMLAAGAPQTKGFVLLLPLFVVAILIVVITGSLRRGLPRRAGRRQPRRRHIAVRIICGVLGAGLLIAVGVGTWLDVRGVYGTARSASETVLHLPSKPAPAKPSAEGTGGSRFRPLGKCRVIVHLVFARFHGGKALVVYGEEIVLDWPRDRGRSYEALCDGPRSSRHIAIFEARDFWIYDDKDKRRLRPQCHLRLKDGLGYINWGDFSREKGELHFFIGMRAGVFSAVPRGDADYRLLYAFHVAAADDPLRQVPLEDYFEQVPQPEPSGEFDGWYSSVRSNRGPGAGAPPFFRLAAHVGVAGLFLLLAAILLAQLFARRGLGFAATVLGCLLFAAVLDRSALAAHSSRLADPQGPLPARCLAASSLTGTFFYRQSAWRAASEAADDDSAPPALRAVAKDVAGWLLPIRDAEFAPPKFSLSWDLKHAENAGFFLEKRHSGDNEHFVLHVPAGKASLGIVPDVKIRMLGRAGGGDEWSAYMPLSWDKSRLVKEYGSDEPSISHNLFSGTMTWTHELKRLAPNILRLVFHLTYTPHAPGADAVKKDVSVTVEVREGSSAR